MDATKLMNHTIELVTLPALETCTRRANMCIDVNQWQIDALLKDLSSVNEMPGDRARQDIERDIERHREVSAVMGAFVAVFAMLIDSGESRIKELKLATKEGLPTNEIEARIPPYLTRVDTFCEAFETAAKEAEDLLTKRRDLPFKVQG